LTALVMWSIIWI